MPELPEVETIVRLLRPRLQGRTVRAFASSWPKGVRPSPDAVRRAIVGRRVLRLDRRGKYIVINLDDGGALLVHLGMSGRLQWADQQSNNAPPDRTGSLHPQPARHIRAQWELDDGSRLLLCDPRKFGRIIHSPDPAAATANLGPEPLERGFTAAALARLLRGRRRQLKPLLLDQSVLAGLGNIYTDEALFRVGLHPTTRCHQLSEQQIRRLHKAIRSVLRLAIRCHGTSLDWVYPGGWMQKRLMVYGRTGRPCRRCGTPIMALRVAQRGTHICPRCQRPPRRASPRATTRPVTRPRAGG